jgi:hypothetical protein
MISPIVLRESKTAISISNPNRIYGKCVWEEGTEKNKWQLVYLALYNPKKFH